MLELFNNICVYWIYEEDKKKCEHTIFGNLLPSIHETHEIIDCIQYFFGWKILFIYITLLHLSIFINVISLKMNSIAGEFYKMSLDTMPTQFCSGSSIAITRGKIFNQFTQKDSRHNSNNKKNF